MSMRDQTAKKILFNAGITSFRQMAGYIPKVMPLDNEPNPMIKDWRHPPIRGYVSAYHYRWLRHNYQYNDEIDIDVHVVGQPDT